MPVSWLKDGAWSGPPRGWRGGGKGNRKAQRARENLKKQLARKLAKEAGTTRTMGKPRGSESKQQDQKAKWMRRRLYGKQKPLGVTAFAKQAQAKAIAAQANADALVAKSNSFDSLASAAKEEVQKAWARAQAAENKAATNSKSFHLLASAAKEEAQRARARAQEAEEKAAVYKDMAKEAHKFANALYGRCSNALGWKYESFHLVGPPLFGGP